MPAEPKRRPMTEASVRRMLSKAESSFRRCWKFLESVRWNKKKRNIEASGAELKAFQPTLADALFALSRGYQRLEQNKNALIERKAKIPGDRFATRMARLSTLQGYLRRAINIGFDLGDGFAWIFYQSDPDLLNEHARQPRSNFLPTGLGGRGEIEFIRNLQRMGDFFLLYHGITSLLRLGDVTLLSVEGMRAVGLGELKTKQGDQPNKLQITLVKGRLVRSTRGRLKLVHPR